jgi:hypothetical protein
VLGVIILLHKEVVPQSLIVQMGLLVAAGWNGGLSAPVLFDLEQVANSAIPKTTPDHHVSTTVLD